MTTTAQVIIENNTFSPGISSDGTTTTNYLYIGLINCAADSIIRDNFISGIQNNNLFNMVELSNGDGTTLLQHIITNNRFFRYTSQVNSYITFGTTTDKCFVTDNSFDQFTCNGSSDLDLVKGISIDSDSIYERNKNQTKYFYIPVRNEEPSVPSSGLGNVTTLDTSYGYTISSTNEINTYFVNKPGSARFGYQKTFSLERFLPQGINIVEAKLGMNIINATISGTFIGGGGGGQINITFGGYTGEAFMDARVTYNILPPFFQASAITVTPGNVASLIATTSYMTFTPTTPQKQYFKVGSGYQLSVWINADVTHNAGTGWTYVFSPLKLTCRW